MIGALVLMAATAVSVNVGWHPADSGGFEYIIQIEPELLDSLANGTDVFSELPPFLRGVRSYRITVGRGQPPREGTPPSAEKDIAASRARPPAGGDAAPQPAESEGPALSGTPAAAEPPRVHGDPNSQDAGARTAGYQQAIVEGGVAPPPEAGSPSSARPGSYGAMATALRDKPWLPLTGALVALFASIGANLYLVMSAVSLRGRYRALASRAS